MSNDLRFPDPVFTRELVLRGVPKSLYQASRDQFDRLRHIRSLGIISAFDDSALQTRHQHLVGLLSIFDKLLNAPKKRGLPKTFIWSFWIRLCYSQIGHAAFSYDSERAVLLAAQVNSAFRNKLVSLLHPVTLEIHKCHFCTKTDNCRHDSTESASRWLENLIDDYAWDRLHHWMAALKLLNSPRLLSILESQDDPIGFQKHEALKILISPNCAFSPLVQRLTELDFVVRDLFLTGRVNCQLDIDSLIAAANESHPDWTLVRNLKSYLSETIYFQQHSQSIRSIYVRSLASLLIKGKIPLSSLFGLSEPYISDDELREIMLRYKGGREVFEADRRDSWKTWYIGNYSSSESPPLQVVHDVIGKKHNYINAPFSDKVFLFKARDPNKVGISIKYGQSDKVKLSSICRTFHRMLTPSEKTIDLESAYRAFFHAVFDRDAEINPSSISSILARSVSYNSDMEYQFRSSFRSLGRSASSRSNKPFEVHMRVGDTFLNINEKGSYFGAAVSYLLLTAPDDIIVQTGKEREDLYADVWEHFIWNNSDYGRFSSKKLNNLIVTIRDSIGSGLAERDGSNPLRMEALTYLEAYLTSRRRREFRFVLPNLKLLSSQGEPEFEFDCISLRISPSRVPEFHIWECTTEEKMMRKRRDDIDKITRVKDILSRRWGDELRVVGNYVHQEGSIINFDNDGIRTIRDFSK